MKSRLDALIFDYLERVDRGDSAHEVLEELCTNNPADSAALRRGVALLRDTRLHPGPAEDGLPERVGQFRLLKRLGAGGMGVVYLAQQQKPTRQVALKLVRPDQLWFEGYRERFTREIESAGRLAHPGIAPVYEMGEHDGVPWFSQEYVVGATLSEILASVPGRSPESLKGVDLLNSLRDVVDLDPDEVAWDEHFFRGTWVDVCLRIARQVADALHHAHERGVLHRDVKPSNILLTPTGRAVLVDFGLANLQGTERLTQSGAQLGSLHYMPPEQIDGKRDAIGARSDVYSLGVTLYELLTLRAPYASKSLMRLRGMILDGAAPEVRNVNRSVPREVSIVIGCAMDPELTRRYATAAEFSTDLGAAQDRRPIAARPTGLFASCVRWVRRRPAASLAIFTTFTSVVIAPLLFAFQSYQATEDQKLLNEELRDAIRKRDELMHATLDGFQGVVRWTAHDAMRDLPGFQEERLVVIDKSLAIFERVLALMPDSRDVLAEQALMWGTRANILELLGRDAEAATEYAKAATFWESDLESRGPTPAVLRQLTSTYYQRALCLKALGQHGEAIDAYRFAADYQQRALDADPDSVANHRDLARVSGALANTLHDAAGRTAEAMDTMERAIEFGRTAAEMAPDDPGTNRALYENLATRADWNHMAGFNEAALEDHFEGLHFIERALALEPNRREFRSQYIQALRQGAVLEIDMGTDGAEVLPQIEEALSLSEALVADYPRVAEHAVERLEVMNTLSLVHRKGGDVARGRELQAQAANEYVALANRNPGQLGLALGAARVVGNLAGSIYFDEDLGDARYDRVLELCDEAVELANRYEAGNPNSMPGHRFRMMIHYRRGCVLNQLEDADGLRAEAEALRDLPVDSVLRPFLAGALLTSLYEQTADEADLAHAVDQFEIAVNDGFEDLPKWNTSRVHERCAKDPRTESLTAQVASRAEGD